MLNDVVYYDFKPGFRHEIEVLPFQSLSQPNMAKMYYPHRASFYIVIWFMGGPYEHQLDFTPIKNINDSFVFVNQGQIHSFDKNVAVNAKLILFTNEFFYNNPSSMQLLHNLTLFNDFLEPAVIKLDDQSGYLRDYFEKIDTEFNNDGDGFHYSLLHNHLSNFLMMAERHRLASGIEKINHGPDMQLLSVFRELLAKNFKQRKPVNSYATNMSISEKRLAQATLHTVGKTPKQLINDRLILEAKRLIIHTQQTAKEVGYSLGFEEPTNFIKFFRKHAHCTPMEFKENSVRG